VPLGDDNGLLDLDTSFAFDVGGGGAAADAASENGDPQPRICGPAAAYMLKGTASGRLQGDSEDGSSLEDVAEVLQVAALVQNGCKSGFGREVDVHQLRTSSTQYSYTAEDGAFHGMVKASLVPLTWRLHIGAGPACVRILYVCCRPHCHCRCRCHGERTQ
jgi:hypothetical protein